MTDYLIILGAGADRTEGIDFPLANTLLADVTRYLDGPGKPVDLALRQMLPGLRFNFNRMISSAVDKIATRETHEQRAMVQRVRDAIFDLPVEKTQVIKHGELIIRLFEKLASIAEQSYLDDDTEALIREVFPDDADDFIDSDSILDIHKLSLSDTFKTVLKRTLKLGLSSAEHEVAAALGADMLNIETLLIEKFLGFYNEKPSDIKNYIYISWALWAFLVYRQKAVVAAHASQGLPFYGSLPDGVRAITLNYTTFIQSKAGADNTIYFHGGLSEYVRMDTRDLLPIENILDCDPVEFIKNTVSPNVDVSHDDLRLQRHVIPALVPPLRLKPILSHGYIEAWSRASDWIKEAKHIVVVGYSFNNADEHFNDILRCCHNGKKVDVVVPEAQSESFKSRVEKVFNVPASHLSSVTVNGISALQAKSLRLIPAKASDIDLGALWGLKSA